MRILAIVPGTGSGFLDDNCLRDQTLVTELRWTGHEVSVVPLFLNMAGSALLADSPPLFYGALRVYLEQVGPMFRNMPGWFRKKLDSPGLLAATRRRMWKISSRNSAEVALSVLRGESGAQSKELDLFLRWLRRQPRPDVIYLGNILLAGFARRIRAEFKIPVVCSIQDEVSWISAMPGDIVSRMWAEIRARACDISLFTVSSSVFAESMRNRIGVSGERMRVIHPAVEVQRDRLNQKIDQNPVWGVVLDKGDIDGLVYVANAFLTAKSSPGCQGLRMCVFGGWGSVSEVEKRSDWLVFRNVFAERGWIRDIVFLQSSRNGARESFLSEIGILTPIHRRSLVFDMLSLEAIAHGITLLAPVDGAYPELLNAVECGLMFNPSESGSLALSLAGLVTGVDARRKYAETGIEDALQLFSPDRMSREMLDAYRWVMSEMSRLG